MPQHLPPFRLATAVSALLGAWIIAGPALAHGAEPAGGASPAVDGRPTEIGTPYAAAADLEDEGFIDPTRRSLPRRHRLRVATRSNWVSMRRVRSDENGRAKMVRMHLATVMLDLGYQLQFFKYLMARPAIALGPNLANSRHSMPWMVAPQFHLGIQGGLASISAAYSYLFPFPAIINATSGLNGAPIEPVMWKNHAVLGEVAFSSRIDRLALTFAAGAGAVHTEYSHGALVDHKEWRLAFTASVGVYLDGTIRREQVKRLQQRTSAARARRHRRSVL
ncbi:MAG: hypothetical protein V3V08_21635 [Nannocystaceae bacterium]